MRLGPAVAGQWEPIRFSERWQASVGRGICRHEDALMCSLVQATSKATLATAERTLVILGDGLSINVKDVWYILDVRPTEHIPSQSIFCSWSSTTLSTSSSLK
jgi:hypothetical protein